MKPVVYVIFGFKRSGKDTVANCLVHKYYSIGDEYTPITFTYSAPIYADVWSKLGVYMTSAQDIIKERKEEPVWDIIPSLDVFKDDAVQQEYESRSTEHNAKYGSLRYFLNEVGESTKKIFGGNFYANTVALNLTGLISKGTKFTGIITDCRHQCEIQSLSYLESYVDFRYIYVQRPGYEPDWFTKYEMVPTDEKEANQFYLDNNTTRHECEWCNFIRYKMRDVDPKTYVVNNYSDKAHLDQRVSDIVDMVRRNK